jgi:iron(III) transport system ATP-binding protein
VVVRRFGDDVGINSFAARLPDTEFFGNRTAARLACEPLGIEIEADLPVVHRDVDPLVPSSMVHIQLPQHALSVLAR